MKFCTFGEVMLRLSTRDHRRFMQEGLFEATFGGSEANVAVSLARFGEESSYLTLLPSNDIADACLAELRSFGVDVSNVVQKPGRIGVYFVERGSNQRASKVIYDREYSVISKAEPNDIDFAEALLGCDWLHVSGVTPAISATAADLTLEAVKAAKGKGMTVSCDLNYRATLWNYGVDPVTVMREVAQYADVLIGNEEDLQKSLGLAAPEVDVNAGSLDSWAYRKLAAEAFEMFPQLQLVATTLRESVSADHNDWSACLYDGNELLVSRKYSITDIVDRVGGGDSFAAGLLYGLNTFENKQEALEFATAAGALDHTIHGDYNRVTVDEVAALVGGDTSGRVRR